MDEKSYMCYFGCKDVKENSKMALYAHLFRQHSASELKKWGLNRDLLGEGLREDFGDKSIKSVRQKKVEGLNERNTYGLNPKDGSQR